MASSASGTGFLEMHCIGRLPAQSFATCVCSRPKRWWPTGVTPCRWTTQGRVASDPLGVGACVGPRAQGHLLFSLCFLLCLRSRRLCAALAQDPPMMFTAAGCQQLALATQVSEPKSMLLAGLHLQQMKLPLQTSCL